MPCVSVVIPTYNHRDYVLQTLDSVFGQTFSDYEVIVVNDGSPDDTAQVLKPLVDAGRIRYFEHANRGQAATRNFGLQQAQGEFIALLDDDDLWPPDKLQWQVELLRERPEVGAVAGDRFWWEGTALPELLNDTGECKEMTFESLFGGNPIASPGQVLIRRKLIEAVGAFNATFSGADDYDLWFRLTRITRFERYDRIALIYRVHNTNASNNLDHMLRNTRKVVNVHAGGLPSDDACRVLKTANRWMYEYVGSRLLARLKGELAHLRLGSAARTTRSLSSFIEWGVTDKLFLARFFHELLPIRQMAVAGLPKPVVTCVRRIKGLGRSTTAKDKVDEEHAYSGTRD
jgi:glycosyltransferase involved in cell wall biosynthesis